MIDSPGCMGNFQSSSIGGRKALWFVIFILFVVVFAVVRLHYSTQNDKHKHVNDILEYTEDESSTDHTFDSSSPSPSASPVPFNSSSNTPNNINSEEVSDPISTPSTAIPVSNTPSPSYSSSSSVIDLIPEPSKSPSKSMTASNTPSGSYSSSSSVSFSLSPSVSSSPSPMSPSISISSPSSSISGSNSAHCIKVGTYNLREGIPNNNLYNIFINYMQEQLFDIIAFQELNNWTSDKLEQAAALWGHSYTTFLQTDSGYHLGFTSNLPFEVIRLRTEGFWHGMIHVRMIPNSLTVPGMFLNQPNQDPFNDINDDDDGTIEDIVEAPSDQSLHFIVTHLDPHSASHRFEEAHHVDHQSREHARLILLGDLNSLSIFDSGTYEENNLIDVLQTSPVLQNKFLYNPGGSPSEQELDYRVMNKFYKEGELIDSEILFRDEFVNTVPTDSNIDFTHAAPMRLDYILAKSAVANDMNITYVDQNSETDLISDHYPVITRICVQ